MDDFNFNTSQNGSYNNYTNDYINYTHVYDENFTNYRNVKFIKNVARCIIIAISLPLILLAIYTLHTLVRKDHGAPIYVINLLISDLNQLCCLIVMEALRYQMKTDEEQLIRDIFLSIHLYGVVVSVGFMVCIALERYLAIVYPLWYRFRRTIKISVVVCVFVWVLPLFPILTLHLWARKMVSYTLLAVFLLLPFPLFIFFLGGTLKALSASRSVPTEEKRRIVGILVLVLLMYTLLFLPFIILLFSGQNPYSGTHDSLSHLSFMFLKLSPLADLVLYIFMRKGAIDKLLASLCCCRMDSNEDNIPIV